MDLWTLKESHGLPASLRNISWMALASQARVLLFDQACNPYRKFMENLTAVRSAVAFPSRAGLPLHFQNWSRRSFSLRIYDSAQEISDKCGGWNALRCGRLDSPCAESDDKNWKKDCQKTIYSFLAAKEAQHHQGRLRSKLERWILGDPTHSPFIRIPTRHLTPHWQARRCHALLGYLSTPVPPRVQSAVFGIIWNRWTTSVRFQGTGECTFGCSDWPGLDKAEHYCKCEVAKEVLRRKLNLNPATYGNLQTMMMVHPSIDSKETLTTVALWCYGLYTTANRLRGVGGYEREEVIDAITQAIREGARGHPHARKVLDQRWFREARTTPLPVWIHQDFDKKTSRLRALRAVAGSRREVRRRLN